MSLIYSVDCTSSTFDKEIIFIPFKLFTSPFKIFLHRNAILEILLFDVIIDK